MNLGIAFDKMLESLFDIVDNERNKIFLQFKLPASVSIKEFSSLIEVDYRLYPSCTRTPACSRIFFKSISDVQHITITLILMSNRKYRKTVFSCMFFPMAYLLLS